jgi:hypothetical protein
MAINFPNSPTIGQSYELDDIFFVWNGTAWAVEDPLQNVIQYIKSGTAAERPVVSSPTLYYNTDLDGLELYYPEVDAWEVVNTFTTQQDPTAASGQALYTSPGTHSWICPLNVYSVDVICVGGGGSGWYSSSGGGGGGGGGLGYKNSISVTPGQSYTVVVGTGGPTDVSSSTSSTTGANGGNSYFINTSTVVGYGGTRPTSYSTVGVGGSYFPLGGSGGNGGSKSSQAPGGGGGAGGYSGSGGNGGLGYGNPGFAGTGGAGGGGGGGDTSFVGGGGGGVGVHGEGASGSGGAGSTTTNASPGTGGSSGQTGQGQAGGAYGGGGGGSDSPSGGGAGGSGAVRIIWGSNRAFPSTNTGDV